MQYKIEGFKIPQNWLKGLKQRVLSIETILGRDTRRRNNAISQSHVIQIGNKYNVERIGSPALELRGAPSSTPFIFTHVRVNSCRCRHRTRYPSVKCKYIQRSAIDRLSAYLLLISLGAVQYRMPELINLDGCLYSRCVPSISDSTLFLTDTLCNLDTWCRDRRIRQVKLLKTQSDRTSKNIGKLRKSGYRISRGVKQKFWVDAILSRIRVYVSKEHRSKLFREN